MSPGCAIPSRARNLETALSGSEISRAARNDSPERSLVVVKGSVFVVVLSKEFPYWQPPAMASLEHLNSSPEQLNNA
jgi:hypothetical protein